MSAAAIIAPYSRERNMHEVNIKIGSESQASHETRHSAISQIVGGMYQPMQRVSSDCQ